jgi:hypothetical protein
MILGLAEIGRASRPLFIYRSAPILNPTAIIDQRGGDPATVVC